MGDEEIPSLTVRSKISLIKDIRNKLTNERLAIFRETCFRSWLQLSDTSADPVLLYKFFQKQVTPVGSTEDEMYFEIGGYTRRFGREDFCLVTCLPFGTAPDLPFVTNGLCMRVFQDHTPKLERLIAYFNNDLRGPNDDTNEPDNIDDHDAVGVCLILLVERFFLGHQSHVKISELVSRAINDMEIWNGYPWGSYIWHYTVKQMYNCLTRKTRGQKMTIYGFLYALKIWILEMFPGCTKFYRKQNNVYPRALSWTIRPPLKMIKVKQVDMIMNCSLAPPLPRLDADSVESSSAWYVHSMSYILGGDDRDDQGHQHNQDDEPDPLTSQVMPTKLKASCIEANNDIERLKEIWLKNRETQLQKEALIKKKKRQLAALQQEITEEEYTVRAIKESYTGLEEMINEKAEWIMKCKNIYPD